nr:MAG TPA: hypothetical protein [Caudoviricetes sp.]
MTSLPVESIITFGAEIFNTISLRTPIFCIYSPKYLFKIIILFNFRYTKQPEGIFL